MARDAALCEHLVEHDEQVEIKFLELHGAIFTRVILRIQHKALRIRVASRSLDLGMSERRAYYDRIRGLHLAPLWEAEHARSGVGAVERGDVMRGSIARLGEITVNVAR